MRTTVTISDEVFREAKAHAARTGRTLGAVIEDGLRSELTRAREVERVAALAPLPTFGRGGVLPGVDLSDNSALADLMDGPAPKPSRRRAAS